MGLENHQGQGGGCPPRLSSQQIAELKEKLIEKGTCSTVDARSLIQEQFKVAFSSRHVIRILREIGMNLLKPYPKDYRRPKDAEEQLFAELKKTFELLKQKGIKKHEIVVGYFDESSPQLTSNTARIWTFEKKPTVIKNTTRIKLNAAGFYALKGNSKLLYLERSTKEEIVGALEKIKEANLKSKAIVLILDNFRSHKAAVVRAKAEELGIYLVFLPIYSPDLNPIEFVWKSCKRAISVAFIKDRPEFQNCVSNAFNESSKKISYARSWVTNFFNPVWNDYENYGKFCH